MTSAVDRLKTDPEPVLCGVCRRAAHGFGFAPKQGGAILWLCDDAGCHTVARNVYTMPESKLNAFEIGAAREAIDVAGPYLDDIKQTDLAWLTRDEMDEFARRFLVAFENAMRRKLLSNEAPF